jgi:hypothetical protein
LAQLTHDPPLAPVEESDAFSDIRNGHRLAIEGADLPRRNLAERLDVAQQHAAPPRFISLYGSQHLGDPIAAGGPRAFERNPRSGALSLE